MLKRTITIATLLTALISSISFTTASATATPSTQTLNMVGGNTDAQHPVGSADPYTDVTIDNGVTWKPAILGGNHPWAETTGTNTWLNCESVSASYSGSCAAGVNSSNPVRALFRYRFWIASDFSNGQISGEFNVDNYASFYLNGIDTAHRFLGGGGLSGIPGNLSTTTIAAQNGGNPVNINSLLVSGWNTFYVELLDAGGESGINYNLNLSITSASAITVAAPGTLVTYDAQGGTVSPATSTVAYNQKLNTITLPTPVKANFTFDGWYTAQTGGTLVDAAYAAATTPTADFTLWARWTAVPQQQQGNNSSSNSNGSTSTPITETPVPAKPIKKLITTFIGDRAELRSHMVAQIRQFVKKLPSGASVTCVGSTSGTRVTAFDQKLAKARATNVCKQIAGLQPEVKYSIRIKPSSARTASARHVWIYSK